MNLDFDVIVKNPLNEIVYQLEKDQALRVLRKKTIPQYNTLAHQVHPHISRPEAQLQDYAISPSFSHSRL